MSSSLLASPKRERVSRRGVSDGPETVDEVITPPRGNKTKVSHVSPARGRKDKDVALETLKMKDALSEIPITPVSPSKTKSSRSYVAATSPGKSPKKSASVLVSSDDESEKKCPITPTKGKSSPKKAVAGPAGADSPGTSLHTNRIKISPRVEKAYSIVRGCTGTLGGNGTTGAIYGELTMGSMQRVINLMVEKCAMTEQSRFIDVGSGLGKPNLHAAQDPQVRLSVGVELETIRWHLAMYNLASTVGVTRRGKEAGEKVGDETKDTPLLSGTNFMVGDIDDAVSTDPFTHIYMYDLGFPPPLQQSIARKFNNSQYAEYLVSYRPPRRVIEEYGYAVEHIDQISTSMHGSGEGHMAYFYKRTNKPPKLTASERAIYKSLRLPARPGFAEETHDVLCDAAFEKCAKLAVGEVSDLAAYAAHVVDKELLNSDRPKRERKPTRLFDA